MSQNAQILQHLKAGKSITPIEALRRFRCFRLAARIEQLRKRYDIKRTMVERGGKRFARYSLQ